jgi:hypothetical protein
MMMVAVMMSMVMVAVVMVRHRGRSLDYARYTNPQAFKLGLLFSQETKILNNAQARNRRAKAG